MRLPRLITLLTLLAAYLVAGLAPAVGSWSCPDGTACVYTAGRGFHCVGDECRMPCCVGEKPVHGCGRCEHGAAPAAGGRRRLALGESPRCRFHPAQQIEPVWVPTSAALGLQWHAAAVLPTPAQMPLLAGPCVRLAPIRGSPPTSHTPPLASPRAPPGSDCA